MVNIKQAVQDAVSTAIVQAAAEAGVDQDSIDLSQVIVSLPPSSDLGDLAFPMFPLARGFRSAPPAIATAVAALLASGNCIWIADARAAGPYVNVFLHRSRYTELIASDLTSAPEKFGRTSRYEGRKVMVEFSCPNTNKPLHLGHLRNNALGSSVARLYAAAGAEVERVNLINDRGVHICKSMLAYREFGNGATPESAGMKSDHFVGSWYVRFAQWAKEDPSAEQRAAEMLQQWEAGDPEVMELWRTMNRWTIDGINQTYLRTGIEFDRVYYESETYLSGRTEIMEGLERGIFYTAEDGAIMVDLAEIGLDTKVLLRKDGTSLYLTQDIGTAIARHRDWPFEQMVYVVGSEQQYHFHVLFHVLKKLGYTWAENLYHLSYGMVNLPDGRMKSREGTVVDADDLLSQLTSLALAELEERGRDSEVDDPQATAHAIALGALHYYLLMVTPNKDMVFDPSESLSFTGNTGPYLQYVGARISSMMRKAGFDMASAASIDYDLLNMDSEWDLIKAIGRFPEVVERSAEGYAPSELAGYLYDLGKSFSRYYHDTPVFQGVEPATAQARLALCGFVLAVMRQGFDLLGIPFLDRM
ncbi:arginine--tRNA ligase [Spirochaeta africana]|uniref:Arginine--tRNA ligase n=1 Tax=Spirochaeta africana (strain ATCC 700263 / DSM 8902 / Z-7692) TaxID=889378 RepID=H9UKA2_SPIAZ|nr:arginine--tRNA ligase [Spirochaeta africana]AFG37945.1 arginyl-tRNA synthetase [Spirochaeta africana DSM 8902]